MEENKRAIIMAVNSKDKPFSNTELDELINLAEACNIEVVGLIKQNLDTINKDTYVGPGKVLDVIMMAEETEVDYIITDGAVSARIIKNFNTLLDQIVIDRNMLILEIFSSRAKSKSAQIQVEIAKINYELPRLVGSSEHLGRQAGSSGGGLANRGLGETKLELERRDLNKKLTILKKQLDNLEVQQHTQMQKRQKNDIFRVALVGYTNAGKSTIMNAILNLSDNTNTVFVKDMLFATLDTFTRNIAIDNMPNFLLSDTIGFINNLHHTLIDAFKSTLSEVKDADLLLHVLDISSEDYLIHKQTTLNTLKEIGAEHIPMIEVHNKSDLVTDYLADPKSLRLSAHNPSDIQMLLEHIKQYILKDYHKLTLKIPYTDNKLLDTLFSSNMTQIIKQDDVGFTLEVFVSEHFAKQIKKFSVYFN